MEQVSKVQAYLLIFTILKDRAQILYLIKIKIKGTKGINTKIALLFVFQILVILNILSKIVIWE